MVRWQRIIWAVSLLALDLVLGDDAEPLVVTSLLEAGKYEEAQKKALVTPDMGGVKSYSGFFHVNKECSNNLFFWFFPAQKGWQTAPVLLWLNTSSRWSVLLEVFMDSGPFGYNSTDGFTKREYSWAKGYNLLFFDHPVGNGFSFTDKGCYPDTLAKIYTDVTDAVVQFFKLFPNISGNPFFIVGQLIAGKVAPGIALEIDRRNKNASQKINLIGIIVCQPYIDTRCHSKTEYEYQLGLIDKKNKIIADNYDQMVFKNMDAKNYTGVFDMMVNYPAVGEVVPLRNVLYDAEPEQDFFGFIRNYKTRQQIHVGNTPYRLHSAVLLQTFRLLFHEPVTANFEELLNTGKYIVGMYAGQLDAYNPSTSIACVLEQLKWPGAEGYLAANRKNWYVGDRLAGWVKTTGNLWEVLVRDSGMYTTRDQPLVTYTLLQAATADRPGDKLLTKLAYEPPTN